MILFLSLVVFLAASVLLLVWMRGAPPGKGLHRTVVLPAAALSVMRVASVWVGSALLKDGGSAWQILGYALLMLTLPEMVLVRALQRQETLWRVTLSVLVVAGSVLWVSTIAALAIAVRRWSDPDPS